MNNLAQRCRVAELMDQPDLAPEQHRRALVGLARLNFLSGSAGALWPPIASLARQLRRPLRVLDLATGGGDVPLGLWRRAQSSGVPLDILGLDISSCALDTARARAQQVQAALRFEQGDALHDEFPSGYDVILCSLFTHHLDEAEATELLTRMAAATQHLVLVNDLVRSRWGWFLVGLASWLFAGSAVVRVDGPRSVRASFTPDELRGLAEAAGLRDVRLTRQGFCRMLLEWRRA